jgi:predicted regulator of Ras-like GTPase activity (Roadblock/LC7/MglB family)
MTSGDAWSFDTTDQVNVARVLGRFREEAGARGVFLVGKSGQLLDAAGRTEGIDGASFASLAAADFAAGAQLAELLGEDDFAALYHQGEPECMYLTDVGGEAILAALFDQATTLGLVRMQTRKVVPELETIIETAAEREAGRPRGSFMEAGWADEAADEIDKLFSD